MLDKLFASFKQAEPDTNTTDDLPRAFAALLVEAARADDEYTNEERTMIDQILTRQFSMDAAAARAVRAEAETAQETAHDLYGFSRVVKEGLDREGKLQLLEDMWAIALSDESTVPYEEMIIRRLIGLIHLEDVDSTLAKRRAAERLGISL